MQNHPDLSRVLPLEKIPGTPVLLGVAGSHAFGLATPDSDVDFRGCYVVPTKDLFRLKSPPDSFAHTKPDIAMHEVGKLVQHAAAANPTALEALSYTDYVICDRVGGMLLGARNLFITDKIRATHLGFAKSQFEKLTKRYCPPGEDARWRKHARHTIRVVRLTERVLTTGEYDLVVDDPEEIFTFSELEISDMVYKLKADILRVGALPSVLPPGPDMAAVDDLLIRIREMYLDPESVF